MRYFASLLAALLASLGPYALADNQNCSTCTQQHHPAVPAKQAVGFPMPACADSEAPLRQVEKENTEPQQQPPSAAGALSVAVVAGEQVSGNAADLVTLAAVLGKRAPARWVAAVASCRVADGSAAPDGRCALRAMLSLSGYSAAEAAEGAARVLQSAHRTGYVISFSQHRDPAGVEQLWSISELRILDETLKQLPPSMLKLPAIHQILRMADGYAFSGQPESAIGISVRSAGEIILRDKAVLPDHETSRTLAHEVGHFLDFSADWSKVGGAFSRLSGWQQELRETGRDAQGNPIVKPKYEHAPSAAFVSEYAASSPYEDFAESVAYYLFDPAQAREMAPEKYRFMKEQVFAGKESLPPPPLAAALDSAFRDEGGLEGSVAACLKAVTVLSLETREKDGEKVRGITYVSRPSAKVPQSIFWLRGAQASPLIRETGCLREAIDKISAQVAAADTDLFCVLGGKPGIEARVSTRVALFLDPVIAALARMVESSQDPAVLECRAKNECREIRAEVAKAVSRVFASSSADPAESQRRLPAIQEEVLRLVLSGSVIQ